MRTALLGLSLVTLITLPSTAVAQDEARWRATLERVVPAVVALKVTAVRDFDSETASNSQGTGFIVDKDEGWILTNRHMVHAGPVITEATLDDSSEIPLIPVYRDPVHDFGFYRFDPADVAYMQLTELPLAPGRAQVGREIRVVGNDAGEKVSILDGTLARLDRNAPDYGRTSYNDFNTFYLQAASNTSGGSSGSPVVDIDGQVVGLNAGGSRSAASSFYLPLERVVRAFELLRAGLPVTRGTLQTTFVHATYAELDRLGLSDATERRMREHQPGGRGALKVQSIVPGGPADGVLLPGDVLVGVDGQLVTDFVALEARLDDAVGEPIRLEVERGGRSLALELTVQDLHAISPDTYLEFGRAVLTPLSYQTARNFNLPVGGVFVSINGYTLATAGVPNGSIITHIDGQPVPDLDAAQAALEGLADRERVSFRFHLLHDAQNAFEAVVVMDRRWFAMRRCVRDDQTGYWPCTPSADPPERPEQRTPSSLILPDARGPAKKVLPSLVRVDFDIPFPTAGVQAANYIGVGVVIDAERGLVLVDRDTAPVRLGDLLLTFAGAVRVPGRVRYLHPQHNFAVVQYDPALLGDLDVRPIRLRDEPLDPGDRVWLVGMDRQQLLIDLKTRVDSAVALELGPDNTPRFRDANVHVYDLDDAEPTLGGVLTDRAGRVLATWSSFMDQANEDRRFRGLPAAYLRPVVEALRDGREPQVRALGAELERITLDVARDRGLSDERIRALLEADPDRRTVFEVARRHGQAEAAEVLRNTDIVLAVDGEPLDDLLRLATLGDEVELTILRDRKERTVRFATLPLDGRGVDRMVSWAGLTLHEPHYDVAAQKGIDARGVYTAWLWFGSPGARDGMLPTRRILAVDDTPTPDLDSFLAAVRPLEHRQAVRVLVEDLIGVRTVETLKMDLHYWPTQLFEVVDGEWVRQPIGESR